MGSGNHSDPFDQCLRGAPHRWGAFELCGTPTAGETPEVGKAAGELTGP